MRSSHLIIRILKFLIIYFLIIVPHFNVCLANFKIEKEDEKTISWFRFFYKTVIVRAFGSAFFSKVKIVLQNICEM